MSGLISTPGYKTIKFDNYVPLIAGELFSVVVKINTPGINGLIAYEYPMLNYSSKATANLGEGYISEDGVAWEDMATVVANASVCLKAFTVQSTELLLSQEVNNSNPQLGDPVQLIIKLLNNGPDNASSVTVKDQIPEGLKFLSYSSNYGTYDPESGVWTIGDIPVGSLAILTLNCIAQQVGSYTNVVTVESATYNPNQKTVTLNIQIDPVNGTDPIHSDPVKQVKAVTIPLKETGIPLVPLIIGMTLVIGGFITFKRK